MKFYPVNLNIENKKCVVVGGGKIAYDKIVGLLEAGALIDVIAPDFCSEILNLESQLNLIRADYSADKISTGAVLIAATNNSELNQKIAADARAKHFLVNIVDDFAGDFIVPSRIRRGDFLLAISTGGKAPAFSRFVRTMLENEFDGNFSAALEIISRYRAKVQPQLPTHKARINFWRETLTPELWQMIKVGDLDNLEKNISAKVENISRCDKILSN